MLQCSPILSSGFRKQTGQGDQEGGLPLLLFKFSFFTGTFPFPDVPPLEALPALALALAFALAAAGGTEAVVESSATPGSDFTAAEASFFTGADLTAAFCLAWTVGFFFAWASNILRAGLEKTKEFQSSRYDSMIGLNHHFTQ